jgi:uncharacterized protein YndB with AHSA1/START domain
MADVTTTLTTDTVSATTVVDAPPEAVFDFLRRPANHALIAGDHTVKGVTTGPESLGPDDSFAMSMKMGVPYRIRSRVIEFEDGRQLAWRHPVGHTWRWTVEPDADGTSRVTETFDLSTARAGFLLRAVGYPKRHEDNLRASVANVASHFAG